MKVLCNYYTKCKKLFTKEKKYIVVLSLEGLISRSTNHINYKGLMDQFKEIKKDAKKIDHIVLNINSPGGSPVQSSLVGGQIRAIADKYDIPVTAFVEDVAASGGYWLACSADNVYANATSIIGSIGVISSGFGFKELIEKAGIERRVFTAGENKSTLDPFSELKQEDLKHIKTLLTETHVEFKNWVLERRANKLNESEEPIFEGRFWGGKKSLELGLIDGVKSFYDWLEEEFDVEPKVKYLKKKKPQISKLLGTSISTSLTKSVLDELEERSILSKFGL